MEALPNERFSTWQLLARRIHGTIDESASLASALKTIRENLGQERVEIYEAGGGARPVSTRWFSQARITVVDLERTRFSLADGPIAFVEGDIRDFCPAEQTFDLVICYYVLEHVSQSEKALENFCSLTKPGGLVFIAAPCFWSLNAMVAKLTPFWFHVWFYRKILDKPTAATKGKAPYRTHHSRQIDPDRLVSYFHARDFDLVYVRKFVNNNFRKLIHARPLLAFSLEAVIRILNGASLYKHDFGEGDFHLVLRKRSS